MGASFLIREGVVLSREGLGGHTRNRLRAPCVLPCAAYPHLPAPLCSDLLRSPPSVTPAPPSSS